MGEGIVREFGLDMYTLLCLEWITNTDLLGEDFGGERKNQETIIVQNMITHLNQTIHKLCCMITK